MFLQLGPVQGKKQEFRGSHFLSTEFELPEDSHCQHGHCCEIPLLLLEPEQRASPGALSVWFVPPWVWGLSGKLLVWWFLKFWSSSQSTCRDVYLLT